MIHIQLTPAISSICPEFKGVAIAANVRNTTYNTLLWADIDSQLTQLRTCYTTESLKQHPIIQATRTAYKRCGKDPSRYRPAAEALVRRVLQGHSLYQISTLVDLVNLVSVVTGYSIGGFDADKIQGETLSLGIGMEGEPYEGIGRGTLNIANLPVYRDASGGIGTPTSDHERTKLELNTTHFLALINGYEGDEEQLDTAATYMQRLLTKYASATAIEIVHYP